MDYMTERTCKKRSLDVNVYVLHCLAFFSVCEVDIKFNHAPQIFSVLNCGHSNLS